MFYLHSDKTNLIQISAEIKASFFLQDLGTLDTWSSLSYVSHLKIYSSCFSLKVHSIDVGENKTIILSLSEKY